ncbi:MAG: hypothetical protein ABSE07_05765 [Methanoregula sp.]
MKKYFGLIIFVIAFTAFTGCTRQAEPVTVTERTIPATIPPTELTAAPTPLPTMVITTVSPSKS